MLSTGETASSEDETTWTFFLNITLKLVQVDLIYFKN